MRRTGLLAGVVAVLAVAVMVPESARAAGILTPEDVPGLNPAGGGAGKATEALGRKLPKPLRKAATQGAEFRGQGNRLTVGVFTLDSEKQAKPVFRALARGARGLDLGDEAAQRTGGGRGSSTSAVVIRVGEVIGAVRLVAKLSKPVVATAARGYGGALAGRIKADNSWDRALAGIGDDGTVTPEVALEAFVAAYGPIPGVKRPKGPPGEPEPTLASQLVIRVWNQLTPEQQDAVEAKWGGTYDPNAPGPARARPQDQEAKRLRPAGRAMTPNPQIQAMAEFYAGQLEARMGLTPPNIRVFMEDKPIPPPSFLPPGAVVLAETLPFFENGIDQAPYLRGRGPGVTEFCRIRVSPAGQGDIGKPRFENDIAHEVFHCFQLRYPEWKAQAVWQREGSAAWAGDALTQIPFNEFYERYLIYSQMPLFARGYDATGFFGHVDELGGAGSLWSRFPLIFGMSDQAAVFDTLGGNLAPFTETWASAMFRLPKAGPAWLQTDPYLITPAQFFVPSTPLTTNGALSSFPYQTRHYLAGAVSGKPLVRIEGQNNTVRVASSKNDFGPVTSDYFCLGGKCTCPPGKVSEIPTYFDAGKVLFIAVTGGSREGSGGVTYHDPKEFCRDKDKPDTGGPSGPGGTNGDPHMTTLDGLHYDFQAAGEFTLLRSDSGDLNIQARQEPWLKSTRATINSQIAMGVEGHRVTVSAGSTAFDPPVLRIDGAVDELPPGQSRALGGGTVARQPDEGWIEVTWPDGSNVVVRGVDSYGVAAKVQLTGGRAGTVSGLLGDFDRNPANDLATRAGKRIPYTAKASGGWPPFERFRPKEEYDRKFFDDLYDVVGDSWRIDQRESLFDYGPGETTKKFTDRSIPERPLDPAKIPDRARAKAERICRDNGVTEPGPLLDCIIDLYVTGRLAFAEDAVVEQADASFSRLAAGAARTGDLSLLQGGDGALHIGFNDASQAMVDVRLDANRVESAPEAIAAVDSQPVLFAGPDGGVRAESAEFRISGDSGIYQYAHSGGGSWGSLGLVATGGFGRPFPLFAGDTLFTAAPASGGVTRLFRGAPAGPGVDPTASLPDCYASSPALARDDATGELWLAWVQWDCPQLGVFVQQVDRSNGQLVGSPQVAPGTAGNLIDVSIGEPLAFTGRPGQGGVYLAYPAADGGVSLWRVGEPGATKIPSQDGDVGQLDLRADPAGGRLWVAWSEDERLWLGRSDGGELIGAPRSLDPPPGVTAPLFTGFHWDVSASPNGLDVLYGYPRSGETPGGIWHTLVTEG